MKIVSLKSLGKQQTYSPEMESPQHNYMTGNSSVIHKNSHAVSYCLVAQRCLWLKAHFAPEWWASVMSGCHPKKLVRYMGVARAEGWEPTDVTRLGRPDCDGVKGVTFDTLNLKNLTGSFTATNNVVNQGLIGIKGIGENAAKAFSGRGEFEDVDDFIVKKGGKSKTVLERFIKLGAFKSFPKHEHTKALWTYYQYKYCSGKDITKLKAEIKRRLLEAEGWDDDAIAAERDRQIAEYKNQYPNRRKIPQKFYNWKPKPNDSLESIVDLISQDEDFSLEEILKFEKDYLGYYLHSPLDLFDIQGDCTIEDAKDTAKEGGDPRLEVIITNVEFAPTKRGNTYGRLIVSDGIQSALVLMWENEIINHVQGKMEDPDDPLKPLKNLTGAGVQMQVDYDESRGTFSLARGEIIIKLFPKDWKENGKTGSVPVLADA